MADQDNAGSGRGENSVLFSLSNLTAVSSADAQKRSSGPASPSPAPAAPASTSSAGGSSGSAGQDRSGLIDLNTLTQLGAGTATSGAGAHAGADAAASAAAVPALFNVGTRRSNKGLFIGIGFLLLVVLGLGGFLTYLLVFKEDPEANKNTASAATAEGADDPDEDLGLDDGAANKGKAVEGAGETAEAKDDAKSADTPDEAKDKAEGDATAENAGEEASGDDAGEETAEATDAKKDDKRSSSSSSRRDSSSSKKKDDKPASSSSSSSDDKPKSSGGDTLDKAAVGKVLSGAASKAKSCGSGGDVQVKFSINPDGSTRGVVTVGGSLAGTPAAKCVEGVVKDLSFPKSKDGATGVKYPFKL